MLSALTETLFLGYMSNFTTETDRIFSKGFSWELKKKNNVEILLPPLCCWGSTSAAPGQSSKGTGPIGLSGGSQHKGDVQALYI